MAIHFFCEVFVCVVVPGNVLFHKQHPAQVFDEGLDRVALETDSLIVFRRVVVVGLVVHGSELLQLTMGWNFNSPIVLLPQD